ncbi:hypothetical protein GB931_12735 [Modestobacter sp. I12A-02628]|uniref:Uncharacterized protein n=1 Tax=Goekera deserti TaxID=2497753 RepID=A0A7K3W9Q9_9ACTN|nr:hypothetical protein [Goekera deserti]MPQ98771.1 hypothetical protein [Goekera deserti]NDI49731.1 hypothetical protein [Goekera deserti]NEL53076.1 hypothetical protein [Goekera deserti]
MSRTAMLLVSGLGAGVLGLTGELRPETAQHSSSAAVVTSAAPAAPGVPPAAPRLAPARQLCLVCWL